MRHWLDPVERCLAEHSDSGVTEIFFRDDDGGWDDTRLLQLLDVTDALDLPIDVAVIPAALSPALADALLRRKARHRQHLGLHQHGYAHLNHEAEGRKCEFGKSRAAELQQADIAAGQSQLSRLLGSASEPIFTPPWNRCSQHTIDALQDCGFLAISRDVTATPMRLDDLQELRVAIDWQKQRPGRDMLATELALAIKASRTGRAMLPVGIMLHHAVMSAADMENFHQLILLLQRSGKVRFASMLEYLTREFQDRPQTKAG